MEIQRRLTAEEFEKLPRQEFFANGYEQEDRREHWIILTK
jgi:hypothetical protein